METLKFKTNAKCGGCVSAIGTKLNQIMTPADWSIDLQDPNKVLQVSKEIAPEKVIAAVTDAGFKAVLL